mgnify:CR=1 FL=1
MIKKVICSVNRGKLEESQHEINCVVINQNNKTLFQSGNTNKNYCLRSTLKPFQCAASLEEGTDKKYKLSQQEIAITCASHHGEAEHVSTVRAILKKLKLTESALECGFHFPLNTENKTKLYSGDIKHSNIYNNCSGKHSGLLAMIKNLGLNKCKAGVYSTNLASIRALEKAGYAREGCCKNDLIGPKGREDWLIYGISKNNWKINKKSIGEKNE